MKVFLAFILAWFKGLGYSHAITESKADAMQTVFGELGKDNNESIELAKTLLIEVHGYDNLVPVQMQARANNMASKANRRNKQIKANEDDIVTLQLWIAKDKKAVADFNAKRDAALTKKEAWS